MRKLSLALVALLATFTATSCLQGQGSDEGTDVENTTGFVVEVSAKTILANGEDTATFRAFYNGEDVTAQSTLYNNATDEAYETMSFSTYTTGIYQFYIKYDVHRSDVIDVQAIIDMDLTTKNEKGLSVSLSTNLIQVAKNYAAFIIRYDGAILSAEEMAKVKIYDASNDSQVTLENVIAEDAEGNKFVLPAFIATEAGTKSFWVLYKTSNTRQTPVTISAVATEIPARPVDPQPEKLNFKRRVFFTQFTGTWCGYCPYMIAAFHEMFEDTAYNDKFVHAAVHAGDKFATTLADGRDLDQTLNTSRVWPFVLLNFQTGLNNSSAEDNIKNIKSLIDAELKKNEARAAIAVRTELKDNMLLARASVKSNFTEQYQIAAWLVESSLYAKQSNGTSVKGDYLDIHENVVRIADVLISDDGQHINGHSLGVIAKGERADHLFVMELDPSWKAENCHLVLFVFTTQHGKFILTNAAKTQSLTSGVDFDYK